MKFPTPIYSIFTNFSQYLAKMDGKIWKMRVSSVQASVELGLGGGFAGK